jgi:hypothetical protein
VGGGAGVGGGRSGELKPTAVHSEGMARFNSGPQDPRAEPFRIREYTDAAAQIHATATELVVLLQALDGLAGSPHLAQVSSQFSVLTQRAQTSGKEVVDYAFQRALLLVLLGCGAVFATALVYRVLNARLSRWLMKE